MRCSLFQTGSLRFLSAAVRAMRHLGSVLLVSSVALSRAQSLGESTNLIAHFRFEDSTADSSVTAANGTFSGSGHAYIQGVRGKAVQMWGDTRIVGDGPVLNGQSMTIAFWYRRDFTPRPASAKFGGGFNLGGGSQDVAGTHLHIGFDYALIRPIRFAFWYDDFDVNSVFPGETGWEHWAFTFDTSSRRRAIYQNGVLIASDIAVRGFSGDSRYAIVGGDEGSAARPVAFDELRIYKTALTDSQISELYKADMTPPVPYGATARAQTINGFVVGASLLDSGYGYVDEPLVRIVGGGGSGATARAVVQDGRIARIEITNAGIGYTSTPTILIASPPFAASLQVEVSRLRVRMKVGMGKRYQLESSDNFETWTAEGEAFIAESESVVQEFDAAQTGRFFRVRQLP